NACAGSRGDRHPTSGDAMLRIRALALVLIPLALVPARPVHAQSIPSPYEFIEQRQEAGLFGGTAHAVPGRFGFGPDQGMVYGARYGVDLSGPFGIEGVVSYLPTTRAVIDPRGA